MLTCIKFAAIVTNDGCNPPDLPLKPRVEGRAGRLSLKETIKLMNDETMTDTDKALASGKTIWNSDGTDGPCLICPPPPKPEPAVEKKWKSTAGPIQSKRVREALLCITQETKTWDEISGVIGGESSTFSYYGPFNPPREDTGAWTKLGEQFGWQVTRENYQAIIEAAALVVEELKKTRPVVDNRRTVEEEAYREDEQRQRLAKEAAYQAEVAAKKEQERLAAIKPLSEFKAELERDMVPTISYSRQHNGIEVRFGQKPSRETLSLMKANRFRWSHRSAVWYRRYDSTAWGRIHCALDLPIAPTPNVPAPEPDRFDMAVEDRMAEACGLI